MLWGTAHRDHRRRRAAVGQRHWRARAMLTSVVHLRSSHFRGYLRDIGQHVRNLQRGETTRKSWSGSRTSRSASTTRPAPKPLGFYQRAIVVFDYRGPSTTASTPTLALSRSVGDHPVRRARRSGRLFRFGQDGKFVKLIQRLHDVTRQGAHPRWTARMSRTATQAHCARRSRSSGRRPFCSTARCRRTSPMRARAAAMARDRARRGDSRMRMASSPACRRAARRWSASVA